MYFFPFSSSISKSIALDAKVSSTFRASSYVIVQILAAVLTLKAPIGSCDTKSASLSVNKTLSIW